MATQVSGKATRLGRKRFDSQKVQGRGSYVTFAKPTYLEAQTFISDLQARTAVMKNVRVTDADLSNSGKVMEVARELEQIIFDAAAEKFVEWNWVDDSGQLLPHLDKLDIESDLLQEEVAFITDAIRELYGLVVEEDSQLGKSVG